jgi:hypothetical protein
VFFVQVGLLLIVMPWWPAFWEHNYFALAWPGLRTILSNNFVRGAVSGLGLVNLCAGFADLALIFVSRSSNLGGHAEAFDEPVAPDPALRDGTSRR